VRGADRDCRTLELNTMLASARQGKGARPPTCARTVSSCPCAARPET
jgi:hypothetical protein